MAVYCVISAVGSCHKARSSSSTTATKRTPRAYSPCLSYHQANTRYSRRNIFTRRCWRAHCRMHLVGEGACGPVNESLRRLYEEHSHHERGLGDRRLDPT